MPRKARKGGDKMESNQFRDKDLKRGKKTSPQGLTLSQRGTKGELPKRKESLPSSYNAFGQIRSPPSSQDLNLQFIFLFCSLWNHEPNKVQMDSFLEYNWTHASPYVRKASTFSGHSYHVNILGPHAWSHQITGII